MITDPVACSTEENDPFNPSVHLLTPFQQPSQGRAGLPFPPEIRNEIYRLVLVNTTCNCRRRGRTHRHRKSTFVQPAFTRVSKQLREEALPIYYGENVFKISIPRLSRYDRKDTWYRFIKMFRVFSTTGTGAPGTSWLRFVRNVFISYKEVMHVVYDDEIYESHSYQLGFRCGDEDLSPWIRGRIFREDGTTHDKFNDDVLDWNDKDAFNLALKEARVNDHTKYGLALVADVIPTRRVTDALWMVARECPEAGRNICLVWSAPLWDV